ncbi:MAG: DNA modification methylase [Leucobacter sp.]
MKIRIASSLAIAAAIALGATGCNLIAPQATTEEYAPSDGIDVNLDGVDVRNMMLIADESGENFNVVFSTVNLTGEDKDLTINFVGEGTAQASADVKVPTGNTLFGNPADKEIPLVVVSLPDLKPGATVDAFFQASGSPEVQHNIPVLDGTLADYRDYVLPADFTKKQTEEAEVDSEADQTHTGDDATEDPDHSTETDNTSSSDH